MRRALKRSRIYAMVGRWASLAGGPGKTNCMAFGANAHSICPELEYSFRLQTISSNRVNIVFQSKAKAKQKQSKAKQSKTNKPESRKSKLLCRRPGSDVSYGEVKTVWRSKDTRARSLRSPTKSKPSRLVFFPSDFYGTTTGEILPFFFDHKKYGRTQRS